jgi:uncharacterized protein (TIGR02246 family)
VVKVPDTDAVRDALDRWKAAIDAQQPERVAEVFTEDAIFQGLRPYSVGRQGVIDYYASQPPGMTVDYQIIQTRPLAPDQVLGYVHATSHIQTGHSQRVHRCGDQARPGRLEHRLLSGVPARLTVARRAYRCGSGRARTSVGHQNHGPRILMMHGTTNERTMSVSSSRPMHTVEPT